MVCCAAAAGGICFAARFKAAASIVCSQGQTVVVPGSLAMHPSGAACQISRHLPCPYRRGKPGG